MPIIRNARPFEGPLGYFMMKDNVWNVWSLVVPSAIFTCLLKSFCTFFRGKPEKPEPWANFLPLLSCSSSCWQLSSSKQGQKHVFKIAFWPLSRSERRCAARQRLAQICTFDFLFFLICQAFLDWPCFIAIQMDYFDACISEWSFLLSRLDAVKDQNPFKGVVQMTYPACKKIKFKCDSYLHTFMLLVTRSNFDLFSWGWAVITFQSFPNKLFIP